MRPSHLKIKSLRKAANMTQQQVADAIGTSRAAVSQWEASEQDNRTVPSYDNLNALATCLNAATIDFFDEPRLAVYHSTEDPLFSAPALAVTFCGESGKFNLQIDPPGESVYYHHNWLAKRGYKAESLAWLSVTGSSMEPALFDGDKVTLNLAATTPKNGVAFAVLLDGQLTIKRLLKRNAQWWITSDNPNYSKFDIALESSEFIIGEAINKQSRVI